MTCGAEPPTHPSPHTYSLVHDCLEGPFIRISPSLTLSTDLASHFVDLYFHYIHVAFHNIFHRPSFEVALRDGTLPKILLLGVISLSARFTSYSSLAGVEPRKRGVVYGKEAEKLIDFHNVSLTTIQACMLVAAISIVEGQARVESLFLGAACRMALMLDLPNAPAATRLERELNLRGI